MINEEENNEIRKILKTLPTVKADDDFLEKLNRRIATLEPERKSAKRFLKEKPGIFERTFGGIKSAWLAPALGLSAAVIFVFYITFMNKNEIIKEQEVSSNKTEEKLQQENTTGNNSPTVTPPTTTSGTSEKKTEPGRETEKDLARNFDNKGSDKPLVTVEKNDKSTYQNEAPTKEPETKAPIPQGIIKEDETDPSRKKSNEKYNEGGKIMEKSRISSDEKKKSDDKSMRTPGEKMEEFEKTIQKSIMDKLNAVNKTNLENLRDKVNE